MKLCVLVAVFACALPIAQAEAAAPVARFTWSPTSPVTGQSVHFDGSATSCTATPCSYTWQDDGSDGSGGTQWALGSGRTLDFTFQQADTKHVRLIVKDKRARSSTVEHDVIVTDAQPPPPPPPPPPASTCASQPYCADFETGNLSQWWITQWNGAPSGCGGPCTADAVGNSTVSATTAPPVKQGVYSGKFVDGPHFGASANDRAEALASQAQIGGFSGQEWYYGWWTYFPGPQQDWWHAGGDWNAFTQFQNTDNSGGAIGFGLDATANQFAPQMFVSGSQINKRYIGALQYDHWYHWVVHLRYSTDPALGLVQIWRDDVEVVPLESRATLKATASPGMYYSQGIYRGAYTSTNTVIHDGFCRAATFAAAAAC